MTSVQFKPFLDPGYDSVVPGKLDVVNSPRRFQRLIEVGLEVFHPFNAYG